MSTPTRDEESGEKAKEHAIRHIGAIGLVGNDKSLTECFLIEAFKAGASLGYKMGVEESSEIVQKCYGLGLAWQRIRELLKSKGEK